MLPLVELRLRTRISKIELEAKIGRVLGPKDYNVLLTGPSKIMKADGRPLCIYLPGVLKDAVTEEQRKVFRGIRSQTTNRGDAAGTRAMWGGNHVARKYTVPVNSQIIGAYDATGNRHYCRLTAWSGRNVPQWEDLQSYFKVIASYFQEYVPERYAAQMEEVSQTDPHWVVPNTPFTTITINNTYPTGVHVDKGDLDKGFSSIACMRYGDYQGGQLVFPEYRVGVDLSDGDLLLMDAHDYHGNVAIMCACGNNLRKRCTDCGAERVSVVSYYRTKMTKCGTLEEEAKRAQAQAAKRGGGTDGIS